MCYHILPNHNFFRILKLVYLCVCVCEHYADITRTQFACMRKKTLLSERHRSKRQRQRETDIVTFSAVDVVTALEQWILLENG